MTMEASEEESLNGSSALSENPEIFYTPPESTSSSLEHCNDHDYHGDSQVVDLGKTLDLGILEVDSEFDITPNGMSGRELLEIRVSGEEFCQLSTEPTSKMLKTFGFESPSRIPKEDRLEEEGSEEILKSLERWKSRVDMLSSSSGANSEFELQNRKNNESKFEVGEQIVGKRKLDSLGKVIDLDKTQRNMEKENGWLNPSSIRIPCTSITMASHPQSPEDEWTNDSKYFHIPSKSRSISTPTEGCCVVNMSSYDFFNELDTDTIGADNANSWSSSSWANGANNINLDYGNVENNKESAINKVQGSSSRGKRVLPSWANEPVKVSKRKLVKILLPDLLATATVEVNEKEPLQVHLDSQDNERVGPVEKVEFSEKDLVQVNGSKSSDFGDIDFLKMFKELEKECEEDRNLECLSPLEVAEKKGWFLE